MAVPPGVDPHEVLGVASGAPPADVTAAYRRLAKRWHPDRAPVAGASDRMALINAAYDELRTDGHGSSRARARHRAAAAPTPDGTGSAPPVWPPRGPG
ncbi:J domain-containing protein, partial [Patulibacter sp.]|uniref:J domain-containing protein n=1 Tax=Patulibacter sp. TaxID=1912859 RepID=UPI0027184A84